jgi:threonyl-tRNA synthetase
MRSYRELPIRFADFGVLHRNEYSGALTGLTRVRRFQQDDAHIFCRHDQIEQEVGGVLDMLKTVYGIFGFHFDLKLSTRPEKYLGEIEVWERAEKALSSCLDKFGKAWSLNPGDGAFYGPKIDIQLTDALKRKHQCATIQLDFQLPLRFELEFKNTTDKLEAPCIIHRAILGSVERMMAVLIEHTGGKWPLWLSPRQATVLPVSEKYLDYARKVHAAIHDKGYYVDLDDSNDTLGKKIREAQLAQYNMILIVGADEQEKGTVNLRNRDNEDKVECSVPELLERMAKMCSDWK